VTGRNRKRKIRRKRKRKRKKNSRSHGRKRSAYEPAIERLSGEDSVHNSLCVKEHVKASGAKEKSTNE
jgi:hypothetical protein